MKYFVGLGGKTIEVELDGETVRVNGSVLSAQLLRTTHTPVCQLALDGVPRPLVLRRNQGQWHVQLGGHEWSATVEDERTRQIRSLTGQSAKPGTGGSIRAPMPGLVVRVEVEEGQRVEPGAGVVVLEAMKMENEITSPTGGQVRVVHVTAGQAVEKGTVLVDIAEPEA
jgi:biotin carboxyl carrier protein